MGTLVDGRRNNLPAVLLEVLPGLFFQIFGIGHISQGRVIMGLSIMFGYWILLGLNILLTPFLIGLITTPLTWIFFLIAAPLNAADYNG
ncbi:MAG: hypothetical protein KTR31_01965 [Myxococcales bacterium]|nr:hypothetical protein [Myxococcales bacterium]